MTVKFFEAPASGVVIARMGSDDLLLEGICEVVRQAGIHTGVLLTGIGSLKRATIHGVATNTVPVKEIFYDLEGPLEVIGFRGIIANYEPHIHISLMDKDGKTLGGHLEKGCPVLTLAEMSILRLPDLRLARQTSADSPYRMLDLDLPG